MSRYTIGLGKARSFSRRKRARKAMSILREQLESREGEKVSISTEVNARIWENGIEKPPASIEVEVVETSTGLKAVLPGTTVEEEPAEEPGEEPEEESAEEEEEEEAAEEQGVDYSEIVSGTVSEAKDQLEELDSPDYEAALEAEKDGKDRKTLKQWLESRV